MLSGHSYLIVFCFMQLLEASLADRFDDIRPIIRLTKSSNPNTTISPQLTTLSRSTLSTKTISSSTIAVGHLLSTTETSHKASPLLTRQTSLTLSSLSSRQTSLPLSSLSTRQTSLPLLNTQSQPNTMLLNTQSQPNTMLLNTQSQLNTMLLNTTLPSHFVNEKDVSEWLSFVTTINTLHHSVATTQHFDERTTTVMPDITNIAAVSVTYSVSFKINATFVDALKDNTSSEYKDMSERMLPLLLRSIKTIFNNRSLSISSLSFSAGSIMTFFTFQLNEDLPVNESWLYSSITDTLTNQGFQIDPGSFLLSRLRASHIQPALVKLSDFDLISSILIASVASVMGIIVVVTIIAAIVCNIQRKPNDVMKAEHTSNMSSLDRVRNRSIVYFHGDILNKHNKDNTYCDPASRLAYQGSGECSSKTFASMTKHKQASNNYYIRKQHPHMSRKKLVANNTSMSKYGQQANQTKGDSSSSGSRDSGSATSSSLPSSTFSSGDNSGGLSKSQERASSVNNARRNNIERRAIDVWPGWHGYPSDCSRMNLRQLTQYFGYRQEPDIENHG